MYAASQCNITKVIRKIYFIHLSVLKLILFNHLCHYKLQYILYVHSVPNVHFNHHQNAIHIIVIYLACMQKCIQSQTVHR